MFYTCTPPTKQNVRYYSTPATQLLIPHSRSREREKRQSKSCSGHVLRRRRLQAPGLPARPPLRLPCPPRLHRRRRRLDRRVAVNLRVSVLPVRDHNRGAGAGADQGSYSRHGVVHRSDPMLEATQ